MLKDDAVNQEAGGLIGLAFGLFVILLHWRIDDAMVIITCGVDVVQMAFSFGIHQFK